MVDTKKIAKAVREILEAVGEDPDREGLRETPQRVAKMYEEVFAGLHKDPREEMKIFTDDPHDEMVILRDISFDSMCEHHLLPFSGKAHVAYIPKGGKISGLSKLARVVDCVARRPQVQERMTTQIAEILMESLDPQGVMVVVEATHYCMVMRGIRKPGSIMATSAVRGIFKKDVTRKEAMSMLRLGRD
jgi:GTP cyclohydrolase I